MKKSTVISIIALLVSIVGLLVALIAYFKRRSCALCDDLDDDLVEYYDEDEEGCSCDDCECDCCTPAPSAVEEEASEPAPDTEEPTL